MTLSRRVLLAATPALAATAFVPRMARAAADPRLAPRIIGNPDAKILVQEWFSLDCPHCAHFALNVFPEVRSKLVETGKIRYQFNDFPLYKLSFYAAMVARALPVDRYEPFIMSLFSSQEAWAFQQQDQGGDPLAPLQQRAALAGMSADQFHSVINDQTYLQALQASEDAAQQQYKIEGTPFFRFGNTSYPNDPETFEHFQQILSTAS
ncbi:thioredoxin domain-containing protein [Tanticharoenia sakaeratensis]|jgi:protein-disulfide isomerase|uniref:Thioredoxin protein n=1 Tax=Tanticharoenia sakaeratensis NBRC 103193 TaxID=1231623 RepID=A0A0D6MI47_9PROT|nr:thioredoxin domain-containing protein [Tanticharoenia sakaeratensis]GAN53282.1 thioredoxin protein [Tanticharoenia sakaeratensis NBRC 103193]GBQ21099.1 thiol:disulfide interchange protein [Tanticharoenia sakaeratensis NBRC 103193]